MAKVKNKRNSGLADKVHKKKRLEATKKKLNPFEVHINKEKHKVLGKKTKHDRGLPGVSRAKAIQKRKETLGTEMKLINKTNAFIDRRIGEKNSELSNEDKLLARFAAERVKQHSRKNIYNLADDEILTHRGQTLEQIEKFDDPRSSDEDDDEGKPFGGLDGEFVSEGHFGGGVLSRTDSKDGAKSHKDLIEQLIAESKKRKAEKQKDKEQTLDLTEKLDSEWKDLQPVVFKRPKLDDKNEEPSIIDRLLKKADKEAEDYDKTMRELKFEKRGKPTDGLKNEKELEKEEREKIEKLEKERKLRMFDQEDSVKAAQATTKHRSADDLDDNFDLEEEPNFMLAYDKDGKPLVPEEIFKQNSVGGDNKKFDDGVSDSSDDGDEDEESGEDESADDEETELNDNDENIEVKNSEEKDNEEESNNINMVSSSDESDEEDEVHDNENVKDKDNDEESDVDERDHEENGNEASILFSSKTNGDISSGDESDDDDDNESEDDDEGDEDDEHKENNSLKDLDKKRDLKETDEKMELENDSVDKIKSFFDLKNAEGENLKELLRDKTPSQQSLVIQKLIKSYDPSLNETNKEKLGTLYAYLLQHLNNIFSNLKTEDEVKQSFAIFDKVAPYLYDLAQKNVVTCKKYLMEVITEKHEDFKKSTKKLPDLDTLIFFKLASLLYPTSDFKHPVVTPCYVFMCEILKKSRFNNVYSISRGIFLTTLLLEYTVLSKRFVPEAVNFLRGIFYLSNRISILHQIEVVPPFKKHRDSGLLTLDKDCHKVEVDHKMAAKDFVTKNVDNGFKIRCLMTCCNILKEMFSYMNDLEAQTCIYEPHINLLNRLDLNLYPENVSLKILEILQYMKEVFEVKTFTPIVREKKKPKTLRMYEPDIQEVFTGSKTGKNTRENAERDKLKHKYRREMKGALREMRRDKAYVASVKIKGKIQSDNIRKEKVKQIYKDASIQQAELNKFKRMK